MFDPIKEASAVAGTSMSATGEVTEQTAYVREKPTQEAPCIEKKAKGDKLTITGITSTKMYYRVKVSSGTGIGWVSTSGIKTVESTASNTGNVSRPSSSNTSGAVSRPSASSSTSSASRSPIKPTGLHRP